MVVIETPPAETITYGKASVLEDAEIELYEKTTNDQEDVIGKAGEMGSDNNHVKLFDGTGTPRGFFIKQTKFTPLVNGKPDNNYAQDGEAVNFVMGRGFRIKLRLAVSQTITKWEALEAVAGGKVQSQSAGTTIAIAAEDKTSGASDDVFVDAWSVVGP